MKAAPGWLVAGVFCAALTEAIAGTVVALGRQYMAGDVHAMPDDLAWLDVGYTAFKLLGFMLTPWLLTRMRPRRLVAGTTVVMGASCLAAAMTLRLDALVALRALQGFAGGTLLVAGQAIIFLAFERRHQPAHQALFAIAAVVAPATLTPALTGWLLERQSWSWIFASVVPLALAACGFLQRAQDPAPLQLARRPFDWIGLALLFTALSCLTWVFSQGSRWNWFEEPRVLWLASIGTAALLAFLGQQVLAQPGVLLDFSLFRSRDFSFACAVSLVAGAALFGTAFLIPSFALSRLGFTPIDAGVLLLPSAALFIAALFLSAFLVQVVQAPPIATVPLGILLIVLSMWMLSGSTSDSGMGSMMTAVLLRGLGLGLLFLSITLVTFGTLPEANLAAGIGLFNAGRLLGGLMGVAALQTLIDHETAANFAVLAANVTAGLPAAGEGLARTTAILAARGLDGTAAAATSASMLGRTVVGEAAVIAFDTAFNAIALGLVVAAPALIGLKIVLSRLAK